MEAHHEPGIPPPFFLLPVGKGEESSVISASWLLQTHHTVPSLQPCDTSEPGPPFPAWLHLVFWVQPVTLSLAKLLLGEGGPG